MKKLIFCGAAAVAMLSLSSCGGNKAESTDTDTVVAEEIAVIEDTVLPDTDTVVMVEETVVEEVAEAPKAEKATAKKPQTNKKTTNTSAKPATKPAAEKTEAAAPAPANVSDQMLEKAETTKRSKGSRKGF